MHALCCVLGQVPLLMCISMLLQVMILSQDKDRGRMSLSTKKLEVAPGDMLRDPQKVFDRAEETAALFRERLAQAEAAARAQTM